MNKRKLAHELAKLCEWDGIEIEAQAVTDIMNEYDELDIKEAIAEIKANMEEA
jgi:ribosomal protein L12E/L44/L45/RPP1/RPP2